MKKAIVSIIMLILLVMAYTNVMPALSSMFHMLNGITSSPKDLNQFVTGVTEQEGNMPPLNPTGNRTRERNLTGDNGIPESGVYTVNQINETAIKEILDPTDWYVGNTSLSLEYAYSVYNDTLKVVENSTETSKSIVERFFNVFKIGRDNDETQNGLEQLLNRTIERVQNITKSTEDYLSSLLGDDH